MPWYLCCTHLVSSDTDAHAYRYLYVCHKPMYALMLSLLSVYSATLECVLRIHTESLTSSSPAGFIALSSLSLSPPVPFLLFFRGRVRLMGGSTICFFAKLSAAPVALGRELSRGGGGDARRGQDEDFDFGELRKGATREQQAVSQASSSFSRGGKHPGDEEDLDFAAVRSKSRPTFSSQTAGTSSLSLLLLGQPTAHAQRY